jgi:hypothetical protein
MTRIELALSQALAAHLDWGMPIEQAAQNYGISESVLIHELDSMEYFTDADYPEILELQA